jgi:hypothetical protein
LAGEISKKLDFGGLEKKTDLFGKSAFDAPKVVQKEAAPSKEDKPKASVSFFGSGGSSDLFGTKAKEEAKPQAKPNGPFSGVPINITNKKDDEDGAQKAELPKVDVKPGIFGPGSLSKPEEKPNSSLTQPKTETKTPTEKAPVE